MSMTAVTEATMGITPAGSTTRTSIDDYLQFRRSLLPLEKMQVSTEQTAAYEAASPESAIPASGARVCSRRTF